MNTYSLPDSYTDPLAFFNAAKQLAKVLGPWEFIGGETPHRIDERTVFVGRRPEWIRRNPCGWTDVLVIVPRGNEVIDRDGVSFYLDLQGRNVKHCGNGCFGGTLRETLEHCDLIAADKGWTLAGGLPSEEEINRSLETSRAWWGRPPIRDASVFLCVEGGNRP